MTKQNYTDLRILFLFLLLFLIWHPATQGQDLLTRPVNLSVENVSIKMVLQELHQNYQIPFAYSQEKLSLKQPITIDVKETPLGDVLDLVFAEAPIKYKVIGQQIILRSATRKAQQLSKQKPSLPLPAKVWEVTQSIRGHVLDQETSRPLVGASVWINMRGELRGVITDDRGQFFLAKIPTGRHSVQVSYVGYAATQLKDLLLIAGKELVVEVRLEELTTKLSEIVIRANPQHSRPLNEMALTSARSFSVEETSRYAASFQDPARMVTHYAGVTSATSDPTDNTISVRGNSPTANLWRLEGIDIPNPNHYATLGSSGGAISMLSSTTLATSDFYTGAYPADFGNALGGIFDLKLRNGNTETKEYSIMVGTLGLEASAEGPLKISENASYLINYRFSTLALLKKIGIYPAGRGALPPVFQDVSFKLHLPSKNGHVFDIFGLGGVNQNVLNPEPENLMIDTTSIERGWRENGRLGVFGISHQKSISPKSFIKSTIAFSHWDYSDDQFYYKFDSNGTPAEFPFRSVSEFFEGINNNRFTLTSTLTKKISARSTLRFGATYNHRFFGYLYRDTPLNTEPGSNRARLEARGYANITQVQAQWKHKWNNNFTLNTGIHTVYFGINNNFSLEPRLALQWQPNNRHQFTASLSRHSKLLHEAYYFVKGTDSDGNIVKGNQNLDVIKSLHTGLSWQYRLGRNTFLKTEAYFQFLYNVPVAESNISVLTQVNSSSVWNLIGPQQWINLGTSKNYGVEWTLEKRFAQSYYILGALSLFNSTFSNDRITELSTRFDQSVSLNVATGKEFKFGKQGRNILGVNLRFILQGGQPYTPIDLEASIRSGRTVYDIQRPFSERLRGIRRLDTGMKVELNRKNITHTFQLDIQNTTLALRERNIYFDPLREAIIIEQGLSIIPLLLYRINF